MSSPLVSSLRDHAVIVTHCHCVAPRFIVKYISSAYFPLDRDIVREMWVSGDLKERLGIQHRRDIKSGAKSDLEQAPIFQRPHFRSESEVSNFQSDTELHNSPVSGTPVNSGGASSPLSLSSLSPPPAVSADEDDLPTPIARAQMNPSPATFRGSYYSASNIPVPSPSSDRGGPPMTSISTYPVAAYPQQPSNTLQIPALRSRQSQAPEAYEMHVRQPSDDLLTPTSHHPREPPSSSSYTTAYESHLQEPSSATIPSPGHSPNESWRDSVYSTGSGPTVL